MHVWTSHRVSIDEMNGNNIIIIGMQLNGWMEFFFPFVKIIMKSSRITKHEINVKQNLIVFRLIADSMNSTAMEFLTKETLIAAMCTAFLFLYFAINLNGLLIEIVYVNKAVQYVRSGDWCNDEYAGTIKLCMAYSGLKKLCIQQ